MKLRGFWGTLLMVAVITIPGLIIILSAVFAWGAHQGFVEVLLDVGLWAGIIFGALMAFVLAFVLRASTIVVPIQDRELFVAKLNGALGGIGYQPESQTQDGLTFGPAGRAGILAPTVSVRIQDSTATIVGPSLQIKKLQRILG